MDIRKTKSSGGIYGPAQIRLTKKAILVRFDDRKNEDGSTERGKDYEIEKENAPKNIAAGHWSVALNSKGDKIYSIRPLAGTFAAKFLKFAASENTPPAPVSEQSSYRDPKSGKVVPGNPQLMFTAIIRVDDEYEYPVKMPYRFTEDDKGNTTITYSKLGQRISKLIDFLDVCGVKDSVIPYTENILPALEEMILDEDRDFIVKVTNGWVDSFSPPLETKSKKKSKKK